MKKLIIGMAAGAVALGASIVPASAGFGGVVGPAPDESIWDVVVSNALGTEHANDYDGTDIGWSDLVLLAGLGSTLDTCGNGKAQFTLFAPTSGVLTEVLADLEASLADLAGSPGVVKALLADHLVNGSFSPEQMALSKKLVARSGYVLNIQNINTVYGASAIDDYYVNGNQVIDAQAACNGWVYLILGVFNPTDYVSSTGMNTAAPAAEASSASLPNTL